MNKNVQLYLKETFGIKVNQIEMNDSILSLLPIFITHGYHFSLFEISEITVLFVERKSDVVLNITQIQKQLNLINERTSLRVAWVVDKLSTYQRKKCIEEQINFIIPYSQLYLPDLLINLSEKFAKKAPDNAMLLPSSQLLLLYHLQRDKLSELSFTEIAKRLGYSKKTISKIADDLIAKDLCELRGTKEKYFIFNSSGSLLWKEVEPLMQNPISKRLFLTQEIDLKLPKSEDEALSHHTFMSETGHSSFAIGKLEFEKQSKENYWKHLNPLEGDCLLEVWKYDPKVLSNDGYIDPLSLYLCFRDSNDERVLSEITQLTNNFTWLKA